MNSERAGKAPVEHQRRRALTAPGEDSSSASFAGIHESYVNITGIQEVIDHIKLVWASLWSDRALLYRRELNLDYAESSMAVLVQEMIAGESSGIAFGKSPTNPSHCVIEAVYGLNQGLVDGTIEPDRWILDRETGKVVSHTPAQRERALRPDISGVQDGEAHRGTTRSASPNIRKGLRDLRPLQCNWKASSWRRRIPNGR
jgi:phosphoenolpyruvate synthase/pyruvate phosphate dikinase